MEIDTATIVTTIVDQIRVAARIGQLISFDMTTAGSHIAGLVKKILNEKGFQALIVTSDLGAQGSTVRLYINVKKSG
jgi:hypothetical protein